MSRSVKVPNHLLGSVVEIGGAETALLNWIARKNERNGKLTGGDAAVAFGPQKQAPTS